MTAGRGTGTAGPWVAVRCDVCVLVGEPVCHVEEAEQLAGVHDQLHHRGHPTATVVSCDEAPAGPWGVA